MPEDVVLPLDPASGEQCGEVEEERTMSREREQCREVEEDSDNDWLWELTQGHRQPDSDDEWLQELLGRDVGST